MKKNYAKSLWRKRENFSYEIEDLRLRILMCDGTLQTCRAPMAADWNLRSVLKSWAISLTRRWKGNFLMSSSVDFWYLLISLRATVPGLYLWGFFTPPVEGADFLAALVASCFLGALPPVDLRAVCLVRAILQLGLSNLKIEFKVSIKCGKWQTRFYYFWCSVSFRVLDQTALPRLGSTNNVLLHISPCLYRLDETCPRIKCVTGLDCIGLFVLISLLLWKA